MALSGMQGLQQGLRSSQSKYRLSDKSFLDGVEPAASRGTPWQMISADVTDARNS